MKIFALTLLAILTTGTICSQETEYQLSTHILDISKGLPAGDVSVKLEKMNVKTESWTFISEKRTEESGRINDFLPSGNDNTGTYRLTFYVADYFKRSDTETFYPFVEVAFEIEDDAHYHVPITLSSFGYSTYRGS